MFLLTSDLKKLGKFSSQDTKIQLLVTNRAPEHPAFHAIALGDLDLKGLLECENAHASSRTPRKSTFQDS